MSDEIEIESDDDDVVTRSWPTSVYTLEERRLELKLEKPVDEKVSIRPFPGVEAEFLVPKRSARWFVTEPTIEEARQQWIDFDWYPPDQSEELLERQTAARYIQLIGQDNV